MNDRSRGKRHFPKGLSAETEPKVRKKSLIVQKTRGLPVEPPPVVAWSSIRKKPVKRGPQMIRTAYFEPLGNSLVENILLQRSFIID